jgi:hypothetical protein
MASAWAAGSPDHQHADTPLVELVGPAHLARHDPVADAGDKPAASMQKDDEWMGAGSLPGAEQITIKLRGSRAILAVQRGELNFLLGRRAGCDRGGSQCEEGRKQTHGARVADRQMPV